MEQVERFRGCLLGLAAGDAVGTTVEFAPPSSFAPVTDMVGGGPFNLRPGQWTDDTSMALCLAESLIERRGFDPADQLGRYVRWYREGHLSSTERCFDIGNRCSDICFRCHDIGFVHICRCIGRCEIRFGLFQFHPEISSIEDHKRIALRNPLIIDETHGIDISSDS